jgi:hypothetical protein
MYPDVYDEMVGRMFINKFFVNGNLFNNFQRYILFIIQRNIFNDAKKTLNQWDSTMVKYKYDLHFEISAVELQQIH